MVGFIYSLSNFVNIMYDKYKIEQEIGEIIEEVPKNVVIENNVTDDIENNNDNNEENNNVVEEQKEEVLTYDFDKLKRMNSDIVGWIEIQEANINYPVVQTNNNDYYLTHSFDKSNNVNGWIFMDSMNDSNLSDQNTIIYAHNSLFKNIKRIYNSNKKRNFKIVLYREDRVLTYEVFSLYLTEPYDVDILNNYMGLELIGEVINKSVYNYNIDVRESDRILTLSTCYNDRTKRVIVHAKLI